MPESSAYSRGLAESVLTAALGAAGCCDSLSPCCNGRDGAVTEALPTNGLLQRGNNSGNRIVAVPMVLFASSFQTAASALAAKFAGALKKRTLPPIWAVRRIKDTMWHVGQAMVLASVERGCVLESHSTTSGFSRDA